MSELEPPRLAEPVSAASRHGGDLLREQRMASGMHIVGLSAMLKVPVARLEALEAGRFEELPDLTFARALASSVCRVLKIDAAPVLAALPLAPSPAQVSPVSAVEPPKPLRSQPPLMSSHQVQRQRRWWGWGLLLLALALLASGAWWWQQPTTATDVQAILAVEPSAPLPGPVAPAADTAPAPEPSAPALEPGRAAEPQTTLEVASSVVTAPAAVPVFRLSVSQVTWVQVLGASGALRLERTLQPGEAIEVSDDLPLQVVIGRAQAAEVKLRGQPLDLAPYTRNQVARLEVR